MNFLRAVILDKRGALLLHPFFSIEMRWTVHLDRCMDLAQARKVQIAQKTYYLAGGYWHMSAIVAKNYRIANLSRKARWLCVTVLSCTNKRSRSLSTCCTWLTTWTRLNQHISMHTVYCFTWINFWQLSTAKCRDSHKKLTHMDMARAEQLINVLIKQSVSHSFMLYKNSWLRYGRMHRRLPKRCLWKWQVHTLKWYRKDWLMHWKEV